MITLIHTQWVPPWNSLPRMLSFMGCIRGSKTFEEAKYAVGASPPNYPVPVTVHVSDIAINWACISRCQCPTCLDHYMDGLELDFPNVFE